MFQTMGWNSEQNRSQLVQGAYARNRPMYVSPYMSCATGRGRVSDRDLKWFQGPGRERRECILIWMLLQREWASKSAPSSPRSLVLKKCFRKVDLGKFCSLQVLVTGDCFSCLLRFFFDLSVDSGGRHSVVPSFLHSQLLEFRGHYSLTLRGLLAMEK